MNFLLIAYMVLVPAAALLRAARRPASAAACVFAAPAVMCALILLDRAADFRDELPMPGLDDAALECELPILIFSGAAACFYRMRSLFWFSWGLNFLVCCLVAYLWWVTR